MEGFENDALRCLLPLVSSFEDNITETPPMTTNKKPTKPLKMPDPLYRIFFDLIIKLDHQPWQDAKCFPLLPDQPFLQALTTTRPFISWNGRTISTIQHREGNSHIQFTSPSHQLTQFGSIFQIFTHSRTWQGITQLETFLAVHTFPPILVPQHTFSHHPYTNRRTRLDINKCPENVSVCRVTDVISQIAVFRPSTKTHDGKAMIAIIVIDDVTT